MTEEQEIMVVSKINDFYLEYEEHLKGEVSPPCDLDDYLEALDPDGFYSYKKNVLPATYSCGVLKKYADKKVFMKTNPPESEEGFLSALYQLKRDFHLVICCHFEWQEEKGRFTIFARCHLVYKSLEDHNEFLKDNKEFQIYLSDKGVMGLTQ